jgi:hypothetical protein
MEIHESRISLLPNSLHCAGDRSSLIGVAHSCIQRTRHALLQSAQHRHYFNFGSTTDFPRLFTEIYGYICLPQALYQFS